MPQIYDTKQFSQKIFKRYHIRSKTLKMPTGALKPSQNEINRKIVKKVVKTLKASSAKGQKPIVVSKDNFVVDGHHRWAAQKVLNPKKKIKVLKMNAPINDALGIAIATESKRDKF
jgi:ParB-like chromosome segregation protein Spo0J